MRDVDALLQVAVKKPKQKVTRVALADLLRADGEEDLAFAVESDDGAGLLTRLKEASKRLKLPVSVKLLWYVHVVEPRVQAAQIDEQELPFQEYVGDPAPPAETGPLPPPWRDIVTPRLPVIPDYGGVDEPWPVGDHVNRPPWRSMGPGIYCRAREGGLIEFAEDANTTSAEDMTRRLTEQMVARFADYDATNGSGNS